MSGPLLSMASKSEEEPREILLSRGIAIWDGLQTCLCITLHSALVVAHVALVVVIAHHYEHRVTVETGDPANRLSTIVTAVTQTIGTVVSTVLVLLTQGLALRRDFRVRQTLSALHDNSNAWLGLGSSVTVLWSQLQVRTAPFRVSLIAAYLAGIFVFHITTPALFNVAPYNVTVTSKQATQLGRVIPNIGNLDNSDLNNIFPEAVYSILEVLPLYPDLDTPGLLNSTLYDVIPILDGATGEVVVNASQFDVSCSAVADGSIGGFIAVGDGVSTPDNWANISIGNPDALVDITPIANPSLVVTSVQYSGTAYSNGWAPFVVVTTTVNVTDDDGSVQSLYPIDPWAVQGPNNNATLFNQMQLLACNIGLRNTTVKVSAATGKLAQEPFNQSTAGWNDWQLPEPTDDPLLSVVGRIPVDTPNGDQEYCIYLQNGSFPHPLPQTCWNPRLFETYLQIYLTPRPTNSNVTVNAPHQAASDPLLNGTVTLKSLNKVMANAFAAAFWYAGNLDYSRLPGESGAQLVQKFSGEAMIETQSIRSQLNLNPTPLYVGLITSVLLLVVSIVLIRPVRSSCSHPELDTTGLLQLTWLVGQEPAIVERVADTAEPNDGNLRRAGLIDVNLYEDGLLHRQMQQQGLIHDE